MAKKENKTKSKKGKTTTVPPPGAVPNMSSIGGVPNIPPTMAGSTSAPFPGGMPPTHTTPLDKTQLTPEQMTQVQLEQAIKESQDPSSKLKKLRSPLSVRGCLLNLLFWAILSFGIIFLVCFFMVDIFNFGDIFKDMMNKFGITQFFANIGAWFKKIFSGGKAAIEIISMIKFL